MFTIGLKILPQQDPSILVFTDNSVTDTETIQSAGLVLTKTDLIPLPFSFVSPFSIGVMSLSLSIFDKDYALDCVYTVVTNITTYTLELQFVTLGYSNLTKKSREFVVREDLSLRDRETFRKETLDINYFRMVAKDRCRFSDLIGAQKALDYIADMNLGQTFSNC